MINISHWFTINRLINNSYFFTVHTVYRFGRWQYHKVTYLWSIIYIFVQFWILILCHIHFIVYILTWNSSSSLIKSGLCICILNCCILTDYEYWYFIKYLRSNNDLKMISTEQFENIIDSQLWKRHRFTALETYLGFVYKFLLTAFIIRNINVTHLVWLKGQYFATNMVSTICSVYL